MSYLQAVLTRLGDRIVDRIEATADVFRALARSSPWRWSTLQFTLTRITPVPRGDGRVRAWLRRPDLLRVETLDGDVIQVIQDTPDHGVLLTSTGQPPTVGPAPGDGDIELDGDGLVRRPRDHWSRSAYDAPMFNSYDWVAMLDPVELADGDHAVGAAVNDVSSVDHHGRPSLQALLTPSTDYAPRCECCALLYSSLTDWRLAESGMPIDHPDGFTYPDATLVRLDVQTGVCVLVREIGGSRPDRGHDMHIEAVDVDMPDALFPIGRR